MDMPIKQEQTRYRAPALDKGLDILELLASEPSGLTRAEIVRATGKSGSEIYRMIERLVARGYISRSVQGDRYELTMKLFLLGSNHPPLRRLRIESQPLMDAFSEQTLQSVHLAALDKAHAVVIAQASGPANWEFRLRIGSILDLLTTGSGEALLAFQNEESLGDLIEHCKASSISYPALDMTAKLEQLEQCKKLGYRVGISQQLEGVTDISVPVLGPDNNAFAVLTCPYIVRIEAPGVDKQYKTCEEALELLLEVAAQLSIR